MDGIEPLRYSAGSNEVLARVHDRVVTLRVRTATASNNVGAFSSGFPSVTPLSSAAEHEREARMLVTDLLDIALQQRRQHAIPSHAPKPPP